MKLRVFAFSLLLFATLSPFAMSEDKTPLPKLLDQMGWAIANGQHDGKPLIIRFRRFPESFPKKSYAVRLNVFWTMSSPAANGMPSDADTKSMQQFEDRLVSATESDAQSVLSIVLTTAGKREFVIHTKGSGEFLKRLTEMPQEADAYPIDIQQNEDLAWQYDDGIISGIKGAK